MRHRNNHGMALILTLMVVTIITAMVVEFAYGVYVSTSALNNWQTSQRLSLLARSTTQLGAMLIAEKLRQPYTYPGVFETSQKAPVGEIDSTITLRIEDENSKFNLNTLGSGFTGFDQDLAPYNAFTRLLEALDIPPDKAKDIANRICYWVNSETDYRPQDAKSATKGKARLDSLDELLLIPGIDREIYEKILPYVTIYNINNLININGASIPVLRSVSTQIKPEIAEGIVRYREKMPFNSIDDIANNVRDFPAALKSYYNVRGTAFRINAIASSGDIKRIIDTVIYTGDGSSRTILYWREF